MDSSETVSNYRNIGFPHIGTYKLNGLTALVSHEVAECIQSLLLTFFANSKKAATVFVDLVHKSKIVVPAVVLYLVNTYDRYIVNITVGKSPFNHPCTASATISQETLNDLTVSLQDNFLAQNARKAANCFVTGDLPVAHGYNAYSQPSALCTIKRLRCSR